MPGTGYISEATMEAADDIEELVGEGAFQAFEDLFK